MLDRLKRLFEISDAPTYALGPGDLQLAVAALLVEAARMDDSFGKEERAMIAQVLSGRFGLSEAEVDGLVGRASDEMQDNVQYFPFTHHINTMMSATEKIEVIEMLWQVAYADGRLDPGAGCVKRVVIRWRDDAADDDHDVAAAFLFSAAFSSGTSVRWPAASDDTCRRYARRSRRPDARLRRVSRKAGRYRRRSRDRRRPRRSPSGRGHGRPGRSWRQNARAAAFVGFSKRSTSFCTLATDCRTYARLRL
jgi:uncharacterized tellurite resistance protein B-like protein